jgi:hypothetical protein
MVLKYPGAKWDPLGTQTEPKMLGHDILCYHTMVGSLAGTSSMFHQNGYGGTESTFGVGESKAQGVLQWQDAMYQADANYQGNPWVTSIETADYGGVFGKWDTSNAANVPAWTADQLDMLVGIGVWYCKKSTHANCPSSWKCHQVGIPPVLIPDTKLGRRGLAYHMQGCRPHVVTGGKIWSTAYGKVCPGNRRTTQLKTIVIPRIAKALAGVTPTPPKPTPPPVVVPTPEVLEDDDMFITRYGSTLYRMFIDRRVIDLSEGTYNVLKDGGVPVRQLSNAAVDALASICANSLKVDNTPTSDTEDAYLVAILNGVNKLNEPAVTEPAPKP